MNISKEFKEKEYKFQENWIQDGLVNDIDNKNDNVNSKIILKDISYKSNGFCNIQ